MRTLAGLGILAEGQAQRFALTPLGASLKTGAPGSARSTLIAFGGPGFSRAWEQIMYSLETGKTGSRRHGACRCSITWPDPEAASHFSEAMVGFHGSEPPTVAEAYDFSGIETVVDVGGATGNMLSALLSRHAGLRGVLFDLPHVVRDAPALLKARGVDSRVTIEEGSFFERVPAGGDAYLMSHIIHDWSEAQCLTILGHCRAAMRPGGRLLIVETVIPEGDTPHQGKLQDLVMLLVPGGQERTEKPNIKRSSARPASGCVESCQRRRSSASWKPFRRSRHAPRARPRPFSARPSRIQRPSGARRRSARRAHRAARVFPARRMPSGPR